VNTSPPRIRGTFIEGSTLTVEHGSWTSGTRISFSYQWQRCSAQGGDCGDIPSQTNPNYLLHPQDIGHTMRAAVTARHAHGSASAVSGTPPVIAARGTAPVNSAPPAISGAAKEGQTLTLTAGSWTGASPLTFSYQWQRCDSNGNGCVGIA